MYSLREVRLCCKHITLRYRSLKTEMVSCFPWMVDCDLCPHIIVVRPCWFSHYTECCCLLWERQKHMWQGALCLFKFENDMTFNIHLLAKKKKVKCELIRMRQYHPNVMENVWKLLFVNGLRPQVPTKVSFIINFKSSLKCNY